MIADAVGREASGYVEVAVPVPLDTLLTYSVPAGLSVRPGCRVRVPLARRTLVGVVMALTDRPPDGVRARPLLEVLDLEPVLPPDLLALARFASEYYLSPIGETVRVVTPGDLPPWGNLRVALTDAGALARPRSATEEAILARLIEEPKQRLAELHRSVPLPDLASAIERLEADGRVSVEQPGRRGQRYVRAVELRPGSLEEHLERCGRSPKARALVELLAALGRPATMAELTTRIGCGPGVVQRLHGLGVVRAFSQPERLSLARHRLDSERPKPFTLRPDQASALAALEPQLDARRFGVFMLGGMTGSGKTEVYLRLAARAQEQGRSALFLVPEIALVPALAEAARARFGTALAILHSNLSANERHQEWERVRSGAATVVLGPRSAVFAPLRDLGVVVVDEEHEAAYKQDKTPRYNGRDLAVLRARDHRAVALLVSATPSLETRWNTVRGKTTALQLTSRAGSAGLPKGVLVDLRQEERPPRPGEVSFTPVLREAIERTIADGDQVILLRNRRGYAPVLLCRACGEDFRCPDCGLPLTLHRRGARLHCHYCEHQRPVPDHCPSCEDDALEAVGAGTERVEERFRELYPEVSVDVLDADAARRPGGAAAILERFARGRSQVLIGTQMVSKGHHFPRVALAGVLFADTYLSFPDFRAVERTYALLTQLAGRAGRGSRPGTVVIQTYHPEHYAIRAALDHDDEAFAQEELRFRRVFHYPPYTRLIQLLVRHKDRDRGRRILDEIGHRLRAHPDARDVRFAGPAPAPLERLRGKWRHQLLIRGPSGARLRRMVRQSVGEPPPSELVVDVDPYDLM